MRKQESSERSLRPLVLVPVLLLAAGGFAICQDGVDDATLSAGSFTIRRFDRQAFSEPAAALTLKQRQIFMVGRNVFNRQWAAVTSLNGDWGLGPTFIADRCSACHINTGRGNPPVSSDQQLLSMLVRLSIPGTDEHGGPKPHPNYGDQIQNRSMDGGNVDLAYAGAPVPNEADLFLDWDEQTVAFADGETVMLRKPKLRVENLKFGALGDDTMISLRMAQPLVGIGFLEAVAEESLLSIADKQRALNFNGRPNRVWDAVNKRTALGRFGWKANVPSLKQQIAAAALGDMGEGLADGRPDFKAGPRDWRTPALWGLGLSQTVSGSTAMLHDGRARNVIEAIFWHGGEAERAREAFRKMSKADREALVRFVETI